MSICIGGRRKHARLFNRMGPTMWNFTVRGMLLPEVNDEIKEMLDTRENSCEPQRDILKLKAEELFIEHYEKKQELWERSQDKYLLELLDDALNNCPSTETKSLFEMNEAECQKVLSKSNSASEKASKKQFNLKVPGKVTDGKLDGKMTNIESLELSLEDDNTITGTYAILSEFSKEFNMYDDTGTQEYVPFDSTKSRFDVEKARSHFELLLRQNHHKH